jgi:hypothetical protein
MRVLDRCRSSAEFTTKSPERFAINPQRPIVADANTLISRSLSGGLCRKSIFDISTRNKDSTYSDSVET